MSIHKIFILLIITLFSLNAPALSKQKGDKQLHHKQVIAPVVEENVSIENLGAY